MSAKVSLRDMGNIKLLEVKGRVDEFGNSFVEDTFSSLLDLDNLQIVCNLEAVEYIGPSALRTFLDAIRRARKNGGDVKLCGVRPSVQRVFEFAGIPDNSFYPDVKKAIHAFGEKAPEKPLKKETPDVYAKTENTTDVYAKTMYPEDNLYDETEHVDKAEKIEEREDSEQIPDEEDSEAEIVVSGSAAPLEEDSYLSVDDESEDELAASSGLLPGDIHTAQKITGEALELYEKIYEAGGRVAAEEVMQSFRLYLVLQERGLWAKAEAIAQDSGVEEAIAALVEKGLSR